jgi:glycerol uptake facilitator-like aquaporin
VTSDHFNPVTTLAFALRRDMNWVMAVAYWIVQFAAAACGSLLARGFFGRAGQLAATMPKPGPSWQAAGFEVIITFGLVLMILNLANGPKLKGRSSRWPRAPTSWPGAPWAARSKAPR